MSAHTPNIAIVGAGIIGLSCAWELSKRGARVTIYEKNWPPRGASWAAAGMLAPACEFDGSEDWLDLCNYSKFLWKGFADALEGVSGLDLDFHSGPSMIVGFDGAAAEGLGRMAHMLTEFASQHKLLNISSACEQVAGLSPSISGALSLPDDGWVDPRAVVAALGKALSATGAEILQREIRHIEEIAPQYDEVLITAGHEAGDVGGVPVEAIKGVMLAYDPADFPLKQVVRAGHEYAVPRKEFTIFGATIGEVDAPQDYLIARAVQLFPSLAGKQPIDHWTGYRPKLPTGKPRFGQLTENGPYIATGHYRNGILLAPITAQIMADMILENKVSELASKFTPDRFAAAT